MVVGRWRCACAGSSAPQQVNICAANEALVQETLEAIQDGSEMGDFSTIGSVFNAAQMEVFQLLEKDSFTRFRRTAEFKAFVAAYNRKARLIGLAH